MKWLCFVVLYVALSLPTGATADQFGEVWFDGRAELDGYRLKVSRYGEERDGYAVMVFVTEPFSESKRVKVDDYKKNTDDVVNVLKLNLVRDFQTGIYDYNTMTSVFSRSSDFAPLKVSFSSQEWCGNVYTEMTVGDRIRGSLASYFEDESGPIDIERVRGGVMEDNLFILLRGLRGDYLVPGDSKTVQLLPGAFVSRLTHHSPVFQKTRIRRGQGTETIEVPAGSYDAFRYEVEIADGRTGSFWIEAAYPHRIVRWSLSPDVLGELTGSTRLPYWELHKNGDEHYLKELGLADIVRP